MSPLLLVLLATLWLGVMALMYLHRGRQQWYVYRYGVDYGSPSYGVVTSLDTRTGTITVEWAGEVE